jgi:transcriptional regulator with XRE-family HTH domain
MAMKLADKIRYLREVEGHLRGLGRSMTQQELVRAIQQELGDQNKVRPRTAKSGGISQSYLSQIESGARPHLTNTTRLLLAKFFKVHPGYFVDDPDGYHAELMSDARNTEDKLDLWLVGGAERFTRDPALSGALLTLANHHDSRRCLLLLRTVIETPGLVDRLCEALRPNQGAVASRTSIATPKLASPTNISESELPTVSLSTTPTRPTKGAARRNRK